MKLKPYSELDTRLKPQPTKYSKTWLFKMAIRDSRKNKVRLFIFVLSIVLGISALVGINSFKESLLTQIDDQAKELLGADLEIRSNKPLSENISVATMDSIGTERSYESRFASMIYFPRTDGTRLVQVRALEGEYPYYGKMETEPENAASYFKSGPYALVDGSVMTQFNVELGDSVKVGVLKFKIVGILNGVPGQTQIATTVAPIVYIPMRYLSETGLLKKGSRINYSAFFKIPSDSLEQALSFKEPIENNGLDVDTVDERKRDTGEAFENLTNFLNLVAFVALLLGCIGVSSSVFVYIKEKMKTVAILRCLGAQVNQVFFIFLIQIALFGFIGSLVGSLLGVILQSFLPMLLKDFIPLDVNTSISWISIVQGVLLGIIISVLFTLIPLLKVRGISPLTVIRGGFGSKNGGFKERWKYVIYGIIYLFILVFSWIQIGEWMDAFIFTSGLIVAFLILAGSSKLLIWLIQKYFPRSFSYVWRQGLSNLYRPNNQTLTLIITIGLGTTLISMLYFMQDVLVQQVTISGAGERPNMVLFDIQTHQLKDVREVTVDYDMPVMQEVPIVTMRLLEINGITKDEAYNDSTIQYKDWVYNREYRITYRDKLIDSETITAGEWHGNVENDSIFISFSEGFAQNIGLEIGDEVLFNVQGALMKTYIGSFREVDWNRVQTNFLVVFPKGVLEKAPQFNVIMTKTGDRDYAARYQQAIVRSFPNISIIDLGLILDTLEEVLGKISFVIRFMALFSIATGLLVLISSVISSKFQRIEENVLLRTLGASKRQIWSILFTEYLILGSLASLTGILISILVSWLLAKFVFEVVFAPNLIPAIIVFFSITGLTILIGMLNSRSVVNNPPLQVIRKEV